MLRSHLLKISHQRLYYGNVIFRAMATRLKDFVSYYDILEIPAECTKVTLEIQRIKKTRPAN